MQGQKEEMMIDNLKKFYSKLSIKKQQEYYDIMNCIKKNDNSISLRLIYWFITQYVASHTIFIQQSNGDFINIYHDYKQQLKAYKQQYFDTFRRRERIKFKLAGNEFETTVGQLNLFKWIIETQILEFIKQNKEVIQKHLQENHNIKKTPKKPNSNSNQNQNSFKPIQQVQSLQYKSCNKDKKQKQPIKEYTFSNKITFD